MDVVSTATKRTPYTTSAKANTPNAIGIGSAICDRSTKLVGAAEPSRPTTGADSGVSCTVMRAPPRGLPEWTDILIAKPCALHVLDNKVQAREVLVTTKVARP